MPSASSSSDAAGRIVAIGKAPGSFTPDRHLNAAGCIVAPGFIDLCARLGEPGNEHARMLESEVGAAIAGGVTSLVCPPDTAPVLDEPGLVEMLKMRAERLHQSRVLPLGTLTRGLAGEQLTEMAELTEAGCIAFGQADASTRVGVSMPALAATLSVVVASEPLRKILRFITFAFS